MKKKVFLSILGVLLLVLIALAVAQYIYSAKYGEATIGEVQFAPESPALGDVVRFSAECRIPWGQNLGNLALRPESGYVACRSDAHFVGATRTGRRFRAEFILRPVRVGALPAGYGEIAVERPEYARGARRKSLEVNFPVVTVRALEVAPGSEIPIADALPMTKDYRAVWWLAGVAALVLAAVAAWLVWRKRCRPELEIQLPPWVVARSELAELQRAADAGTRPLPWCVARLTDVVRDYLSARFAWPIRQQTTAEFLSAIRRDHASPLSAEETRRLGDFMNAADLVKFAKVEPDAGYFHGAVHHAEELIAETEIHETPESGKDAEK